MSYLRVARVVFVGSNPTEKTEQVDGRYLPFKRTRSLKVLKQWVEELGINPAFVTLTNAYPGPTKRPPTAKQLRPYSSWLALTCKGADAVVALGATAATALELAGVHYLRFHHPSGRNRILNDKTKLRGELKWLAFDIERLTRNKRGA